MVRSLVLVGSKGNVYGVVRQRQTGSVVVILGSESDGATYAGRGSCNRHRGIRSFIAGDEIQSVQPMEKRVRGKGAIARIWTGNFRRADYIDSVGGRVDHWCSGNPYLRIDVAKTAEAYVADVIPDDGLLAAGSTV